MKKQPTTTPVLLIFTCLFVLNGCSSSSSSRYALKHDQGPERDIDVSRIPDAVPRPEPRSKYGNPRNYVVNGQRYHVMSNSRGHVERGVASWYGKKFHGHRTSSGETYDMYSMTAAHKHLPLPTYVRVTHLENGRSVIVRVNDRGPFHANRVIDLSYAAASKLGITAQGTGIVEVRAIDPFRFKQRNSAKRKPQQAIVNQTTAEVNLYLQVGAFVNRNNAEQLRQQLNLQFAALNINAGYNAANKLYRVRIGPLISVEEADKLAERINQSGLADPHIVVD